MTTILYAEKQPDMRKCKEALIYVAQELTDLYQIVKALYYADKHHLSHYGGTISGDKPVAMEYGPVPSLAYDLMKYAFHREGCQDFADLPFQQAFTVLGRYKIQAITQPDKHFFSKYDLISLEAGIQEVKGLNFNQLKNKSHEERSYDKNWKEALAQNPEVKQADIPLEEMILMDIENGADVLEYLENCSI